VSDDHGSLATDERERQSDRVTENIDRENRDRDRQREKERDRERET